jgi:hypothetical protein
MENHFLREVRGVSYAGAKTRVIAKKNPLPESGWPRKRMVIFFRK